MHSWERASYPRPPASTHPGREGGEERFPFETSSDLNLQDEQSKWPKASIETEWHRGAINMDSTVGGWMGGGHFTFIPNKDWQQCKTGLFLEH